MSLFRILTWPIPFKGYIVRQLIALDQAFNTLTGGQPDETLSSRLGRKEQTGDQFADVACDILDVFEQDHCKKSIEFTTTGEPDAHHLTGKGGLTGQGMGQRGGSVTEVGS